MLSGVGPDTAAVLERAGAPVPAGPYACAPLPDGGLVRRMPWPGPDAADLLVPRTDKDAWEARLVEAGARLERSSVRGPAVIGAGALVRDAYVGPYTAVGAGCVVDSAEVEHSILLEGSQVIGLDGRMESSLLGKDVRISRGSRQPRAYRFMVGDNSEIGIL